MKPPGLAQKSILPAGAGGPGQSRFRAKAPLHVLTMAKNQGGGAGGAIETPKRHFNVKGGPNKNKAMRMTVMEHHSAGLRPHHKAGVDPDSEYATHAATPAGGPNQTQGPGKNFNTLSQISSVVSNSEQSNAPNPAPRTTTKAGASSSAFKAKGAKQMMKDQASKLRAIDERYERTNQMIEHLTNTGNKADPDEESGAGSPLRAPARKKPRPKITDFKIEGVVGVGNFGKVHKAYNLREDRVVALKMLVKESVAEMKHVDHVINEREVLQYLSEINQIHPETNKLASMSRANESDEEDERAPFECPFLMNIYSSFQDKENLYFELEYIEGCTLLS